MARSSILVVASSALLGSQAVAENWVDAGSSGIFVDTDTVRRGTDGLVYFSDKIRVGDIMGPTEKLAMDCSKRLTYVIRSDGSLSYGNPIQPNSTEDTELKFICSYGGEVR